MNDYSLRIAHDHFNELREARQRTRRTRRRNVVTQRRTTPKPTTE
ncbi:MAG TPA: hypothetical protein VLI04_18960 [Nocardioidaceae bacterium]|nr:hypothetical protein [Nocardioidaceae bacterium]